MHITNLLMDYLQTFTYFYIYLGDFILKALQIGNLFYFTPGFGPKDEYVSRKYKTDLCLGLFFPDGR